MFDEDIHFRLFSWGRRWPTFCFFLIAEVCLLGSVAVKLGKRLTNSSLFSA